MELLLDMNISPDLCDGLANAGWKSIHWSAIGEPSAPDTAVLEYAKARGYVLLTHDLDFSAILSATRARAPSVVQVRFQDVLSKEFQRLLTGALKQFEAELDSGALVVVDENRSRARILPIS